MNELCSAEELTLDLLFKAMIAARDGHCAICMKTTELKVHRIYPEAQYPALRWDPVNGIMLCDECINLYKDNKDEFLKILHSSIGFCRLELLTHKAEYLKSYQDYRQIKECLESGLEAFGGKSC